VTFLDDKPRSTRRWAKTETYHGVNVPDVDPEARRAKLCPCPEPQTYSEPDGERRCICGREARPGT
jgi:hypothetical protein